VPSDIPPPNEHLQAEFLHLQREWRRQVLGELQQARKELCDISTEVDSLGDKFQQSEVNIAKLGLETMNQRVSNLQDRLEAYNRETTTRIETCFKDLRSYVDGLHKENKTTLENLQEFRNRTAGASSILWALVGFGLTVLGWFAQKVLSSK
jgi:hypothetical protein